MCVRRGKKRVYLYIFFLYIHKISLEGYTKSNYTGCLQEWEGREERFLTAWTSILFKI